VARADGLVRRGTLAEALDGLDRRLDALGPPLRDLVTDWLRVEAMPWWQLEEILRKHSRLDREEIRSCPLWWRRPRVRDVLARRIVEALPADSGLGYVSDAGDMFQLGRVVAATRRADPGGELWPVFHLDASPGGYSANGLFVKPDSPVARDLPAFATAGCSELGELAWAPRRYAEHGYILIFDQTIARSGLHVGRHAAGALDPGVARHLERRHGDLTALVEDPSALEATVAEYVIAHELGHARYHRPDRQNHPTAEAWANQGALELLIPWLGQSERAHLELLAAKKLNRFERIFQADAPESLFHVQDAILLPALLTSDPVTTHRTHTQRLQEILGDPEKLLEENQELGLGYVRGVVRETLGGGAG
jgi:hypothetical protein